MLREEDIPLRPHASPVRVYRVADLPPEEQAKYQPVRPTRRDLLEAAAQGLTAAEVAARYGRSVEWVRAACIEYGIKLRRTQADGRPLNITPEQIRRLRECWQQRIGATRAAEIAGVSINAAYRHYRLFTEERKIGMEAAMQAMGQAGGVQEPPPQVESDKPARESAAKPSAVPDTGPRPAATTLCATCIKADVCLIPDALAVLTPPKPALDVTGKLDRVQLDLAVVLRRCSAYWPA